VEEPVELLVIELAEPSEVDGEGGGALNGDANAGRVGTVPPDTIW
jgi:hypothetical protein